MGSSRHVKNAGQRPDFYCRHLTNNALGPQGVSSTRTFPIFPGPPIQSRGREFPQNSASSFLRVPLDPWPVPGWKGPSDRLLWPFWPESSFENATLPPRQKPLRSFPIFPRRAAFSLRDRHKLNVFRSTCVFPGHFWGRSSFPRPFSRSNPVHRPSLTC